MSAMTADFVATPTGRSLAAGPFAEALQGAADWVRRRRSIRMHRRILNGLPDGILKDIGISRETIDGYVLARLDHAGRAKGRFPY